MNQIKSILTRMLLGLSLVIILSAGNALANVSHGSEDGAKNYYRSLPAAIGFSSTDGIFDTTLDDVAAYLGYGGLTGADLQNLSSEFLMNSDQLLSCSQTSCPESLQNKEKLIASLNGGKIQPDDILVSRFFAPKITNIKDPDDIRKLGWRKLVRFRARLGSGAQLHNISYGIILFNFFTNPGEVHFSTANGSVNTQVMLVTDLDQVPPGKVTDKDTIYWLDYDTLSNGGKLSLALNASFDANELPPSTGGVRPYHVPDGCVACHGSNAHRSIVNYLDTDHWFDRLGNDFLRLNQANEPLLVDAKTNDVTDHAYLVAFDVIRRFNREADAQAQNAQPKHDEVLAAQKWLDLHELSDEHFAPIERVIGPEPRWSAQTLNEAQTLNLLNQYCFRCHGSVTFSVFNKQKVASPELFVQEHIDPNAFIGARMPPDRPLPDDVYKFLHDNLPVDQGTKP